MMPSSPRPPNFLLNQRFGKLIIKSLEPYYFKTNSDKQKRTYKAICLCDCGNQKKIHINSLKSKRTKSCGCYKDHYDLVRGENNKNFKGHREIRSGFWRGYIQGAKDRNIDFDLDIKDAWDLYERQNRRCILSGLPIIFGTNASLKNTTASIDRIDIKIGYNIQNIQWVHKKINLMRNVLTVDDFIYFCKKVAETNDSL